MIKYKVVDWAGNVMNWGEFEDMESADIELDSRVNEELAEMGLNLDLIHSSGLEGEYSILEEAIDKIVTEFRGEYYIEEFEE